jgi:N-acetylneuraminic acid mutarotase
MNNGVTVESGDRFKQLIDKIATMVEEGSGKGIQFAEGNVETSIIDGAVIETNLDFIPTYIFCDITHNINMGTWGMGSYSIYNYNVIVSNITNYSSKTSTGKTIIDITINNVNSNSFSINKSGSASGTIHKWYAIGVGEEDTTLRDSLADILENKGVDITEEDDMASLITKVDNIRVNNMPDWLVTNEWYQKVASKSLTSYAMTGSVKDIIYSIGGGDLGSASKIFNCFLPASNTWSTRAALPSGVSKAQTAVYDDNYIYCFGGRGDANLKTNYCYDYSLDTWTNKADMPSSEFDGAGAILDTTIYCIAGKLSDNANRTYDILTNTWSTKTALPATRAYCEAVGFNGFVYVYGGTNGNYSQSTMHAYDPSIDTWTVKASGGISRLDHVMVVIKDRIYCSGGQDGGTSLRYYNPVTDSWTNKAKLPVEMGGVGTRGAAYNGILYHFGSSNLLTYIPD